MDFGHFYGEFPPTNFIFDILERVFLQSVKQREMGVNREIVKDLCDVLARLPSKAIFRSKDTTLEHCYQLLALLELNGVQSNFRRTHRIPKAPPPPPSKATAKEVQPTTRPLEPRRPKIQKQQSYSFKEVLQAKQALKPIPRTASGRPIGLSKARFTNTANEIVFDALQKKHRALAPELYDALEETLEEW